MNSSCHSSCAHPSSLSCFPSFLTALWISAAQISHWQQAGPLQPTMGDQPDLRLKYTNKAPIALFKHEKQTIRGWGCAALFSDQPTFPLFQSSTAGVKRGGASGLQITPWAARTLSTSTPWVESFPKAGYTQQTGNKLCWPFTNHGAAAEDSNYVRNIPASS